MIEQIMTFVLLGFLVVTSLMVVALTDLFAIVVLFGIYSLLSASIFLLMGAADVAFTEAVVGAGISTVLMFSTLALTGGRERPVKVRSLWHLILVMTTGLALIWGTMDLPHYGDGSAPAHQHVAPKYIEDSPQEIGIPNLVTAVLASYRGLDTLGEVVVVFTAGLGVMLILGFDRSRKRLDRDSQI